MWWKLRRHRVAVVSGAILLAMYAIDPDLRVPRALQAATAATPTTSTRRRSASICSTTGSSSGRSSMATTTSSTWTICARVYTAEPGKPQPLRFFCRGDTYRFWGLDPGRLPPGLPGRGRAALPARHRPARPRHALAHHLRRAHLADRRADRRRGQLHARHRDRRHRRLLRRLDRHADPARRSRSSSRFPHLPLWMALSAILPVTWSPILVYFGITIILGMIDWTASRARRALEAAGAARGGFLHRRGADGRDARRASSAAICCRAS